MSKHKTHDLRTLTRKACTSLASTSCNRLQEDQCRMSARHIWSSCIRRVHSRPLVARWYSWTARLHSSTSQNSSDRVPDQVKVRYTSSIEGSRELRLRTQDRKPRNAFSRHTEEPLDFYEYHLRWPMKPLPLLPCSWVEDLRTSPDGLSEHMQNDPLEILKSSGADPKIVTTCLETFIARSHASAQNDKVTERRIYVESRAGVSDTFKSSPSSHSSCRVIRKWSLDA